MCARQARPAMGIATERSARNKIIYLEFLDAFSGRGLVDVGAHPIFAPTSETQASHPVNRARPGVGYVQDVLAPLYDAFDCVTRQNYIVLAGEYLGTEWVTSTGYFYGHFARPLWGIPASGNLAFLRFGEFHRMEDGHIVESHVFLGLAELVIALGLWPYAPSQGYEGTVPGPATHDGIWRGVSDPVASRASADLVEDMLMGLASEQEAWRPYWDDRMVWYGPGGLGTYAGLEAFAAFQRPFEQTFDGWGDRWVDGIEVAKSSCKSGDGDYAFLCGWPQLTGVQVKPFLGIAPTGKRVFMRDCDWWRLEGGKIVENWCMLDIPHVLLQLGHDLFADLRGRSAERVGPG